jgi:S-adenosylmethionine/arginine decarboxylase-like enzyme
MALHNQLLVNGKSRRPMSGEKETIAWMKSLVEKIDMKIIQGPYASYVTKEGNRGVTCVVMIETSHIALHVWDEEDPALIQFDLYTCSTLPVEDVLDELVETFDLEEYHFMVIERAEKFNLQSIGHRVQED